MGLTHVTVSVSNLAQDQRAYEAEFLVDTGAIDCLVPASALKSAGIRVEGNDVYETANGTVVEYRTGSRIKFMGAETVGQVIFGPDGCEPYWAWSRWRTPASGGSDDAFLRRMVAETI